jgi:hypothetical protein
MEIGSRIQDRNGQTEKKMNIEHWNIERRMRRSLRFFFLKMTLLVRSSEQIEGRIPYSTFWIPDIRFAASGMTPPGVQKPGLYKQAS